MEKIASEVVQNHFDSCRKTARAEGTLAVEQEDFPENSLFSGCGGDYSFLTSGGWFGNAEFVGITGFRYFLVAPWGTSWRRPAGSYQWEPSRQA